MSVPETPAAWSELAEWSAWVGQVRLGAGWAAARGAEFWRQSTPQAVLDEARAALQAHLEVSEAWSTSPDLWGEVVGGWVRAAPDHDRLAMIAAALRSAPESVRPRFAVSLVRHLPSADADAMLGWIEAETRWDRSIVLPLKVRGAIASSARDRQAGAASVAPHRDVRA